MSQFRLIRNNRGDTIVEVLIAIAVVSLALAGAFNLAANTSKTVRTAQERGEALKLAEAQAELIRTAVNAGSPDVKTVGNFCLTALPVVNVVSAPCSNAPNGGNSYDTTIQHTAGASSYSVIVTWDSLLGGKNNLELDYKAE